MKELIRDLTKLVSKWYDNSKLTATQHAEIDNTASPETQVRAYNFAWNTLHIICEYFKKRAYISSWFRCEKLNTKVKGSKTSLHLWGQAIDFNLIGFTPIQTFFKIYDSLIVTGMIEVFEMILEPTWVHIGIKYNSPNENLMKYRYVGTDKKVYIRTLNKEDIESLRKQLKYKK